MAEKNMNKKVSADIEMDFDAIVIGGGITGVGVFRDLAMQNLKVLVIDENSFMSQTSSRSSKMLHGGIRYIEQGEFKLVKEALAEKNLWVKLLPQYCQDASFLLPIYKRNKYPLFAYSLGFEFYDFLSGFKNKPYQVLRKEEVLHYAPQLSTHELKGSILYHDAIMDDYAIGIFLLQKTLQQSSIAQAMDETTIQSLKINSDHTELKLFQKVHHKKILVRAKEMIICCGPFTDLFMQKWQIPWTSQLVTSKGSHLYLKRNSLNLNFPLVIQSQDDRVIFVIPHQDRILVGTTEIPWNHLDDPRNVTISESEIDYLLGELKFYFPETSLSRADIISAFAGIRPLVSDGSKNAKKTSRTHHHYHPYHHVHAILGGKYTTFRVMAQEMGSFICEKNKIPYNPSSFITWP